MRSAFTCRRGGLLHQSVDVFEQSWHDRRAQTRKVCQQIVGALREEQSEYKHCTRCYCFCNCYCISNCYCIRVPVTESSLREAGSQAGDPHTLRAVNTRMTFNEGGSVALCSMFMLELHQHPLRLTSDTTLPAET